MKKALITGITGQDGAHLAKNLLEKGYEVYGGERRTTTNKYWRLDELGITDDVKFVELDVIDQSNIRRAIEDTQPDEVYNLAAQSFVALSFKQPELATLIDGVGVLRILESIKQVNPKIKFYQASTSEMYGSAKPPQNEETRFWPRSPYGVAKLFGHHITINYRESYNMFACNGILFNHEGPFRGTDFVTRKITKGLVQWKNTEKPIVLGNFEAKRDWGHAEDFVEAMHLMLQHNQPDDYVVSTGKIHTVRQFLEMCLVYLEIDYYWKDNQVFEKYTNKLIVKTDQKHLRPAEVDHLQGDSSKIRRVLGWKPKHDIDSLISDMIDTEIKRYG